MARRRSNGALGWLRLCVSFLIACLLFVVVLQFDQIESRIERVAGLVEEVGRRVENLAGQVEALRQSAQSGRTQPAQAAPVPSKPAEPRSSVSVGEREILTPDPFVLIPPGADRNGSLTVNLVTPPKGFNIVIENSVDVSEVYEYVTESLAQRHWKEPEKWSGALAESITVSDDWKVYTVRLREGVKWHRPVVDWNDPRYEWLKGDHYVTADDVKFAVEMILNPDVPAAHLRNYYQDLASCTVVDSRTLVFRWKRKLYHSLSAICGLFPLPRFLYAYDEDGNPFPPETIGREFTNHWYNDRPIGCGPYRFVRHETGVELILERNEEYWGPKPAIKRIRFVFVRDPNQRLLKLRSGELDLGALIPSQYRQEILEGDPSSPFKDGRIQLKLYQRLGYTYFGWNMERVPFNDKRVRQAMTYAFNREGILKNVLMGLGTIVTGNFFINSYAYNHKLKPRPFDLRKAAQLLTEAGWVDRDGDGVREKEIEGAVKRFEFDMLCWGSSETFKTICSIYKEDLRKIGVLLNVQALDWAIMQKRMEDRDFDAYTGGWGLAYESDPYQIWHSSQADIPKSSNMVGFRNAEADRIIEKARQTFDMEERKRLFHRFHEILYEEQPYTFFYTPTIPLAYWHYVRHLAVRAFRPQVNYKSIWISPH